MKIANIFFENMAEFNYLGTPLTIQKYMFEEIKSRSIWIVLGTVQFRISCLSVCCV
jgi:hypothetical protein